MANLAPLLAVLKKNGNRSEFPLDFEVNQELAR